MLKTYRLDTSGLAAVETALMLPMLALAGFGAMDASLLMLQNHKMESGLSAAGNYLAKTRDPQTFELQAKNLATTGQILPGGVSTIQNWVPGDVSITYKNVTNSATGSGSMYNGGATIDVVQLSSDFDYQGLGFLSSLWRKNLTISASYEERIPG